MGGISMKGNRIKNSYWHDYEGNDPCFFKTNQKLHFDKTEIDGYRVASLSFSKNDYERLVYKDPIGCKGFNQVTIGLVIRGNDIDEINYKIGFYDENNSCLDVRFQNIASEIKPTFKRICVTYPIPSHTHSVKVGWEFKGIVTGVTIFHPSVDLY